MVFCVSKSCEAEGERRSPLERNEYVCKWQSDTETFLIENVGLICERGDLNPYGLTRWILSPVRLPIPPLSRA
jgi:hypothetical protein